ncbi:MAG: response regulator, partial [Desulfatibacillaceae bacterium]|nr:response regulator [Desulfatibacillaceae bacterium]
LARDITQKWLAQEEKKRLEEKLTQVQKLEAVGTLAGGVAHDFNNLLMGLSGNVSILLLSANPDDSIVPRLKEMERCVRRGADMTRRLLAFSRKGIGRPRPMDINALILETAAMFGRTHKDVSVNMNLAPDIATVEADPGQMEQVFMNLFLNAGQAMPRGGTLTVSTANAGPEKAKSACQGSPALPAVRVMVSDTGHGMSDEVKARIFEPFFSTKPMSRGTGLGLFSAYGIISNHGGAIDVESEPEQGTTFIITLPACEKAAEIPLEQDEKPLYGRETILLVDDEQMVLQATSRMLEALGYTVIQASGGREAVDIYSARAREIDLVILDIVMPDMHGSETFRWLALMNPTVRVLLATGYSANGEAAQLLSQGCDAFIQKPFDIIALSRLIRKVLEQEKEQPLLDEKSAVNN